MQTSSYSDINKMKKIIQKPLYNKIQQPKPAAATPLQQNPATNICIINQKPASIVYKSKRTNKQREPMRPSKIVKLTFKDYLFASANILFAIFIQLTYIYQHEFFYLSLSFSNRSVFFSKAQFPLSKAHFLLL
jgi:hypothetical protein